MDRARFMARSFCFRVMRRTNGIALPIFILLAFASMASECFNDTDPGDIEEPDAVLLTPMDGSNFGNGPIPISFSITENEALQSWTINVRNENFGASVWAVTENTAATSVMEDTVYVADVLNPTEFLIELIVVDANQNEDIEKATVFVTP